MRVNTVEYTGQETIRVHIHTYIHISSEAVKPEPKSNAARICIMSYSRLQLQRMFCVTDHLGEETKANESGLVLDVQTHTYI